MHKVLFLSCLFVLLPLMLGCESLDPIPSQFAPADSEIYILRGHKGGVNSVAFSSHGQMLASGDSEGTIQLWNVLTRRHLKTLKGHKGSINSLSFNPAGLLASGSSDGTIRIWGQFTGKHLKTLEGHEGFISSVSFDPAGLLASGSSDGTIRIWDPYMGEHLKTLKGHVLSVNSIDFHPTEPILASGSDDETIRLWNPHTGEHLKTIDLLVGYSKRLTTDDNQRLPVFKVIFSPDGQTLASTSHKRGSVDAVLFWNWASKSERYLANYFIPPTNSDTFTLSRDGQMIVTADKDKLDFWDLDTLRYGYMRKRHIKSLPTIVEQYEDWGTVWKLSKKDKRTMYRIRGFPLSIAISPDGQMVALGLRTTAGRLGNDAIDDSVVLLWTAFSLE